jgi:multiple sugar transport system permease protein
MSDELIFRTSPSAQRHRRRSRRHLVRSGALPFLAPGILFFALMFGYPIYQVFHMAFSDVTLSTFASGNWKWVGFENFRHLPTIPGWNKMLRNTAIFLIASTVPQIIIGSLLAVSLHETSRIRRMARSLVLLPWLFPVVATSAAFLWMFQSPEGVFNSLLTSLGLADAKNPSYFLSEPTSALIVIIIMNVWIGIPFCYLLIQSGLQAIPRDLHESAALDGTSWFQELTLVTIPLLRETLLALGMLVIMGTLNVFAYVWIVTQGGPANATMLPGVFAYQQAFVEFNFGGGSAVVVLMVVVLITVGAAYVLLTRQRNTA